MHSATSRTASIVVDADWGVDKYRTANIYLLPIDNTYTAAAITWNRGDPNYEFFRRYIEHIARYMAPHIRRLPVIPYRERYCGIGTGPFVLLRITHDSHDGTSNTPPWPFDEEPNDTSHGNVPGPMIDYPMQTSYQETEIHRALPWSHH